MVVGCLLLLSSRGVGTAAGYCRAALLPLLPGSGVLPTVGRGIWWVLPYYRGAPMVGCPLQWGEVDSGCFPTIGITGLWVCSDSGCLPTIKALSDVALTFK